jgi:predicted DNA-binding helix-hairpin-helix protein
MDAYHKLSLLANFADLEPAEETHLNTEELSSPTSSCSGYSSQPIYHADLPGGKKIKLLKSMLSSACERDCFYCPFRAGRDFERQTFKPDEMSNLFVELVANQTAEGLFLSSGVAGGGIRTQDRLLDTAEILRFKKSFRGYLHLKIMPGSERDQVLRAMQLADRISINLEAPNNQRLPSIAPHKVFLEELLHPLQWAEEIRRTQPSHLAWNNHWPSLATQFVVDGAGENDLELLSTSNYLLKKLHLGRIYYSAFRPILNTPLENHPAENPIRQDRLYQAFFLMRDYAFDLEELPFTQQGNLPLDTDPKLAWARINLSETPIELNKAEKHQLLRIPGIGPKNAEKILAARLCNPLRSLTDLQAIGIHTNRLLPFVLLDGHRPTHQQRLFF